MLRAFNRWRVRAGGAPLQPKYALASVKYLCVTVGKAAAPFYNHGTMSETNLKQNQAAVESAAAERDGAESGVVESAASEPVVAETSVAHKSGVSAAMQKEAFQAAWPIVLGYIVLGIPCGILGVAAGMDVWMIAIMSLLFYSGAGQYMIPNMWLAGNPISAIIASVALVNTRQMLYGASLSQFCGSAGKRLAFIFGATVTDESFGVNLARMINGNWSVKTMSVSPISPSCTVYSLLPALLLLFTNSISTSGWLTSILSNSPPVYPAPPIIPAFIITFVLCFLL